MQSLEENLHAVAQELYETNLELDITRRDLRNKRLQVRELRREREMWMHAIQGSGRRDDGGRHFYRTAAGLGGAMDVDMDYEDGHYLPRFLGREGGRVHGTRRDQGGGFHDRGRTRRR